MAFGIPFTITIALLAIVAFKVGPALVRPWLSPLKQLPGPPNPSWLFGHFRQKFTTDNLLKQEQWVEKYGNNIVLNAMFGAQRLYTHDLKALNHVLTHSTEYRKPLFTKFTLSSILGKGVLVAEGEQHKIQRRAMNPAFGTPQVRELTEIIVDKASELRDLWKTKLSSEGKPTRINVLDGLSRMALDVIGLAGFDYDFGALNPDPSKPNELNTAFKTIFEENESALLAMARIFIPPLRLLPTERSRRVDGALKTMHRIGMELIQQKKAAILSETSGSVEKSDFQGKDLLSLLIKANMASDVPENMRMSDEDVLAQVPTFIVAGHETTATAVTWCLYSLSQAPEVQMKLRKELLQVTHSTPSMEELTVTALPYLDMVVRETLRLHAPVPQTIRVAEKDDQIPVSTPYKDRNGVERDSIQIAKGDLVAIPIAAVNRDKHIWGEGAFEFRPERWENLPEAVAGMPGVWGHVLSFLDGPRACIGYRFALIEIKALLFTLIRTFEFDLAVKPEDVSKFTTIVQRPVVLSEPENGSQMPLLVKLHHAA
ncbi:hypothetical protein EIP91_006326 [Steccherinum ochraceum]|uniref:Cytochrome P450-dit2 n=1 Tax=Steccherinum ochraceum TaxID=92696 RepID=A0A4R0RVD6_9APHY|nr:hypothetical protein EIP91_006326 [Steccherinum ochraceum]